MAEFEEYGGKMHAAIQARHGETLKFGPATQTLYTTSAVISDYATKLGARATPSRSALGSRTVR